MSVPTPPAPGLYTEEVEADRPKTFDPFSIPTRSERRAQLEAYLELLAKRDGEVDFANRTLSERERQLQELGRSPVTADSGFDREGFRQRFHRKGRPPVDSRTLWALVLAKASEGENYGVVGEIRRYERMGLHRADPRELYVLLEENYHSRILLEAGRTIGVDLERRTPATLMKWLIRFMQHLPNALRYIPILCGEILSREVFRLLRERAHELQPDPEGAERIRRLLQIIETDEVLHVLHCRARMRPISLRLARLALPVVVWGCLVSVPELRELGFTTRRMIQRLRDEIEIPDELEWTRFENA